jgi:hypothetical protein
MSLLEMEMYIFGLESPGPLVVEFLFKVCKASKASRARWASRDLEAIL